MVIDAGRLLDVEDFEYVLVGAIGDRFVFASSQAAADFSDSKSSSDNWGDFSRSPPPNGRIVPVESDGLWSLLDGCPLVLGPEHAGAAQWALVFRRRNTHRARVAIRARRTTPPITPPAITPLCTDKDKPPMAGVGSAADEEVIEDVLGDGEGVGVGV